MKSTNDPYEATRKETYRVIDLLYPDKKDNQMVKEYVPDDWGEGYSEGLIVWFHNAFVKFEVVKKNEEYGNCDKNDTYNSEYWKEMAKSRGKEILNKIKDGNIDLAKQALERWGTLKDRFNTIGMAGSFEQLHQSAKKLYEGKITEHRNRNGVEHKSFIYSDEAQRNISLYLIAKTGIFKIALDYKKSSVQFQRDLHNNLLFVTYPILEIRNRNNDASTRKLAVKRTTDQYSETGRLITKIENIKRKATVK
jgi:hypothetical protein